MVPMFVVQRCVNIFVAAVNIFVAAVNIFVSAVNIFFAAVNIFVAAVNIFVAYFNICCGSRSHTVKGWEIHFSPQWSLTPDFSGTKLNFSFSTKQLKP